MNAITLLQAVALAESAPSSTPEPQAQPPIAATHCAATFLVDIPLDSAVRAFHGTSFAPEKRGASYQKDYADTLAADYAEFSQHAKLGKTEHLLEASFARYRAGYRSAYSGWLGAKSRCISSMITGPSNFPVARAQRANQAEHGRLQQLIGYREKVKRAIIRELRPDWRPIMAGDANAIERLAVKIANEERSQALMVAANKVIRQHAKQGPEKQIAALVELGISSARAGLLLQPDWCGRIGFAGFELTNNSANIRRNKERLAQLERAHSQPIARLEGQGVRLEDNPPENRIRLFFDDKPDRPMRERLKGAGFRWAPTLECWQAYRNRSTLELASAIVQESNQDT